MIYLRRHASARLQVLLVALLLASCGPAAESGGLAATAAPDPAPAEPTAPKAPVTAEASPYGLVGADYACAPCESVLDFVASASASSVLQNKDIYGARSAFDGDPTTAWCEGVDGTGVGQTLTLKLTKPVTIDGAFVLGGYFKSKGTLKNNTRLKTLAVRFAGMDQEVVFSDPTVPGPLPESYPWPWFHATTNSPAMLGANWPQTLVQSVEFEVKDTWPGAKYTDLCISEINLLVIDPEEL